MHFRNPRECKRALHHNVGSTARRSVGMLACQMMADRTELLIERNRLLLAKAEVARCEARQITARAQGARLQCQIMQEQALVMLNRFPSPIPIAPSKQAAVIKVS